MIRLSPVVPTASDLSIDLEQWQEDASRSGAFGTTWVSPDHSGHILKRLHDKVPRVESLRRKRECAAHARSIIIRLTEIVGSSPTRFVTAMCERLRNSVTTHVGYDPGMESIFLYQRLAPGCSLEEVFLEEEPEWSERVRIAQAFASAMVTLRRCNVIHLDCRPVNVFVDRTEFTPKITLIDLDGCGVLADNAADAWQDSWSIRPETFGIPDLRPIWFPFDASWQMPRAGNFKFAERWQVLGEVWRILSWSRITTLGWLSASHVELFDGFDRVRSLFDGDKGIDTMAGRQAQWDACKEVVQSELAVRVNDAISETVEIDWEDYGLSDGTIECNTFLDSLAGASIIGMLYPKWGMGWKLLGDLLELPRAKWIQDQLISLRRI